MVYTGYYNSPIGILEIKCTNKKLIAIQFIKRKSQLKTFPFLLLVIKQLDQYFKGKLKKFNIPLDIKGTQFQEKVWQKLLTIPFGQTKAYQEIAKAVNNSKASRAVGNAVNKNRIAIIIPCHRVIGSNNLGGYAGGINKKEWLLNHESNFS